MGFSVCCLLYELGGLVLCVCGVMGGCVCVGGVFERCVLCVLIKCWQCGMWCVLEGCTKGGLSGCMCVSCWCCLLDELDFVAVVRCMSFLVMWVWSM